jgi:hypothetical protein
MSSVESSENPIMPPSTEAEQTSRVDAVVEDEIARLTAKCVEMEKEVAKWELKKLPVYGNLSRLEETCSSFVGQTIKLTATFMGRDIRIDNANAAGDILEDVFFSVLKDLGDFEEGPKQASPDFYGGGREFQFEQKVYRGSAGFDIGNFDSFVSQLSEPGGVFKKLFKTKYLVYKYSTLDDGIVKIEKFSMLDVWQLPLYTGCHPLSLQEKRGMWYNLRPGAASSWTDPTKTAARFIESMLECIEKCPNNVADRDEKISSIREQFNRISTEYAL